MTNEELRLLTPIKFMQDLHEKLYPHIKVHPVYMFGCESCSEMYQGDIDCCGECGRPYEA